MTGFYGRSMLALAAAAAALAGPSFAGAVAPSNTGTNAPVMPVKRRARGWSFAHVKRMKTKRRNKLRAKGQFRKAVR